MKQNHIGEISYTTYNTPMKIIEYKNNINVLIEFQDNYKVKKRCTYQRFKDGRVRNPYDRSVYGIGFIGECKIDKKAHRYWEDMFIRCYNNKSLNNSYKNTNICEEWLCFANFQKWFFKNYYQIDNKIMTLDKDICNKKEHKIYSPKYCIFIPKELNSLFVLIDKEKVIYKNKNKFYYYKRNTEERKNIMVSGFNTYEEAYEDYKKQKEENIRKVIIKYKKVLPEYIFNILYNYKI